MLLLFFSLSKISSDLEHIDVALMDSFFFATLNCKLFVKYHSISTQRQIKFKPVANLFVQLLAALVICSIAGWDLAP